MEKQTKKLDPAGVKALNFKESFQQLTKEEKLYCYYFYRASWDGFPIILFQFSPEGPIIFSMFQKFFRSFQCLDKLYDIITEKTSKEICDAFFEYCATFYDNTSNYRSFGFDKIYSDVDEENFRKILNLSEDKKVIELFDRVSKQIFDKSEKTNSINLYENGGVTAYYLGGINKEEIELVDKFLEENNISVLNTRLLKINNNDKSYLIYLVASVENKVVNHNNGIIGIYGEFDYFLKGLNENLLKAKKYTDRENQTKMIDEYVKSFNKGCIEAHKQSQIYWVKDLKPVVETNIGWIETYIDPLNRRAYYEGLVALVDKENTKKFSKLVENAGKLLYPDRISWNEDFENYPFKEPDYNQIDVVCFASDGCPLGINIPNYDDIREKYGYKNVTIGNNQMVFKAKKMNFLPDEIKNSIEKNGILAYSFHVACHELLGHGSGKLCREENDGVFNFKKGITLDPYSNQPCGYYQKGEVFEKVFGDISRSYEECRADLSGLYFGKLFEVAEIFGATKDNFDELILINWYSYIMKGINGLKFFNNNTNKWGQAHTQGSFVFSQFIIDNQKKEMPIITIDLLDNDFKVTLSYQAIKDYGHDLVSKMLTMLNVWKSTANGESGRNFYNKYSSVNELFLKLREIVIEKSPKRMLTVNHNLKLNSNNEVEVIEYEESYKGIIKSYIDRFTNDLDDIIVEHYDRWDKNNVLKLI